MLQTAHPDRACSGAVRGPAQWNPIRQVALLGAAAQAPPLATVSRPSSPLDVPERDPSRKPERPECRSPGAFHFWNARDRNPDKNPFPFNVLAALTGTNRGNVEGGSTSQLRPFEGNLPTRGRVWVFCLPPATSAAAGEGALQAKPCCLKAQATCSGTPTPGPGWD